MRSPVSPEIATGQGEGHGIPDTLCGDGLEKYGVDELGGRPVREEVGLVHGVCYIVSTGSLRAKLNEKRNIWEAVDRMEIK